MLNNSHAGSEVIIGMAVLPCNKLFCGEPNLCLKALKALAVTYPAK